ncbi:hypothetical protein [Gloeothece citriformis]|uniref:hypothetical protein n=1 Tax=Gloeothece citriformis TaxID=2546356 RepID=UPI000173D41C|nr:hypothetical protein [Gloeothece citriformis]
MSDLDQLDYVERYFHQFGRDRKSLQDLYMMVLWPAGVGKSENYGLFTRPGIAYRQNWGLDLNGNGVVSVSEAVSKVRDRFLLEKY